MSQIIIYHNPRCSKSRQTLEILQNKNLRPIVVDYLQSPPSAKEIKEILTLLKMRAFELIRVNEAEYSEAQVNEEMSEEQLCDAMHKYPKLIQRPIVVANGKAVVARPPELVLDIL